VISLEELQLAARNHGMPLEALRYPITPIGLHYVLTHYDIPPVDAAAWRLSVGGLVERQLSLSLDEIRARPAVEVIVTMECAGNGRTQFEPRPLSQPWIHEAVGTARWTGTPLRPLLEEAGVRDGVVEVVFSGLDRGIEAGAELAFERSLPVETALGDELLLAYEINGVPLPPQHGFPVRLLVPGWYGMASVKWLHEIAAVDRPFTGHQQAHAYRLRLHEEDEGIPLTRIPPRALMIPPGIPDFPTRHRTVTSGPCILEGRAWSGLAPVEAVEVSTDGGATWARAELGPAESPWAWRGWSYAWDAAVPGEHVLSCRARDEAGNTQPAEPLWNVGGYANSAAQRVTVTVAA
jgi:DMSO/TMAO reductase YedYZ molybdopterin-dependent catalytic subunit